MAKSRAAEAAVNEEIDFEAYANKAPSDLQARFGDYIVEKLGLEFGTKKEEAAFRNGVRLATALRMVFQRSPENQEVLEQKRTAPPAEKVAKKAAAAPEDAAAKKGAKGKKAVPAAEATEPAGDTAKAAPRKVAGKKAPGKTAAPF